MLQEDGALAATGYLTRRSASPLMYLQVRPLLTPPEISHSFAHLSEERLCCQNRNTPQVRLQQYYSGHATQLVGAGHSSTCMVGIASLRV